MTGTYTRIEAIYGPSEAVAGSTVNIEVEVKNLFNGDNYIYVDGAVDGVYLDFGGYYLVVPGWQVVRFHDSFIMPSKSITLKAVSYYYGGSQWNKDDEFSVSIKAIVGAWISLATSSLGVKKAIVGGWIHLASGNLAVGVGVVAGQDIFKSLAVDFEKNLPEEFR